MTASRRAPNGMRDLSSATRLRKSSWCNRFLAALRKGRVLAGSMPTAACSGSEPYTVRNVRSASASLASRHASSPATIWRDMFSYHAMNGLSAAAGLRCLATFFAMSATGTIMGLILEKSSY